jgi:hypothetical protein
MTCVSSSETELCGNWVTTRSGGALLGRQGDLDASLADAYGKWRPAEHRQRKAAIASGPLFGRSTEGAPIGAATTATRTGPAPARRCG